MCAVKHREVKHFVVYSIEEHRVFIAQYREA